MDEKEERRPRSKRRLARHEAELWQQVTRHVKPMPGKALLPMASPTQTISVDLAAPKQPLVSKPEDRAPSLKPLAPLEHKTIRRLSRGHSDPEAKLDLHGMRQAEAHVRLRGFLHNAHANGLRLTLVVTGKGATDGGLLYQEERGVLRRMVPHWLAAPDLRMVVLGFSEASRRHGGEGAFYVRLRASASSRIRRAP
jgi:DNA-nicking Smr family endonuclease